MLNLIHKAWSSCHRHKKKKKGITNKVSPDLQKHLLLIHLPTELLSKIILELLNEWALVRSFKMTHLQGSLDNVETLRELSTYQMIPLTQVNKFFYKLVWTITMKYSYWNQEPGMYEAYTSSSILYRSRPFVFNENMIQSRGIEPGNQFHLEGPLSQNQLRLVRHVIFQNVPFLFSSVRLGSERIITIPKLQYLTTLKIDTENINSLYNFLNWMLWWYKKTFLGGTDKKKMMGLKNYAEGFHHLSSITSRKLTTINWTQTWWLFIIIN